MQELQQLKTMTISFITRIQELCMPFRVLSFVSTREQMHALIACGIRFLIVHYEIHCLISRGNRFHLLIMCCNNVYSWWSI